VTGFNFPKPCYSGICSGWNHNSGKRDYCGIRIKFLIQRERYRVQRNSLSPEQHQENQILWHIHDAITHFEIGSLKANDMLFTRMYAKPLVKYNHIWLHGDSSGQNLVVTSKA
jgi:hypothetical protein